MRVSGGPCLVAALVCAATGLLAAPKRPYELEWAGRTSDDHAPLCALESFAGWTVETHDAVASLSTSPSNLLFGAGTARLTYRADGSDPLVFIRPPEPVPLRAPFDTVTLWICGNVSPAHFPDPSTPVTEVDVEFRDSSGETVVVPLATNNHCDWCKEYRRLSATEVARLKEGGAFTGIRVREGRNAQDRSLDFNSLCVYRDEMKPLSFRRRPRRGVVVFPGQPQGVNTGDGRLPFPDRKTTVVPCPEKEDRRLEFRFPSDKARWDDLAFRWNGGPWVKVAVGGGLFPAPKDVDTVFRRVGNSIVADVVARGGTVEEVRFGTVRGLPKAEFVPLPYYTYKLDNLRTRPGVVAGRLAGSPFFISQTMDWTQSGASTPFGEKCAADGSFGANGGVRYLPRTDGRRNDVYERFVWSFSTKFAEVLPVIPNPPSPWRAFVGARTWFAHPTSQNRADDVKLWTDRRRNGYGQMIVTDHETQWRDWFESFTYRTEAAPAKGGDKGQFDYTRTMIDTLGYSYGPYNCFCEMATVNRHWDPDRITRDANGQLLHSWERCYVPKAAWMPTVCDELTSEMQRKYAFNTGYCDVHTFVTPWSRTDYDARVPGAGTFAQTFYSYGEVMLIQKRHWKGPVFSEGSSHWMYAGLTDGNYAQDPEYRIYENPWLVDFDLLRIHPLECDYGMGTQQDFPAPESESDSPETVCDRFLAASLAFGHSSFLVWAPVGGLRRCHMMVRPVAAKYSAAEAVSIRYADAEGRWHETSDAIANGAFRRSQVSVRYSDGTRVTVNGNRREPLAVGREGRRIVLPPNGWLAVSGDKTVLSFSGLMDGERAEYGISPDGTYSRKGEACDFSTVSRNVDEVIREIVAAQRPLPTAVANRELRPLPVVFYSEGEVRYGDRWALWPSDGDTRRAVYMVGTGARPAFARYRLDLADGQTQFSCSIGKVDGSYMGDGIVFRVVCETEKGDRHVLAERLVQSYGWQKLSADLSPWRNKTVFLRLETAAGPSEDWSGDCALWSDCCLLTEKNEHGKASRDFRRQ